MYRRPKFQEILLEIRQQMACDADYDVDLFAEMVRTGAIVRDDPKRTSVRMTDTEIDDTPVDQLEPTFDGEYKRK